MNNKELAEHIQVLQDIEAIKQLKYRYSEGCDLTVNEGNPEPLLRVFTPDAVWEAEYGRYSGADELKIFADSMRSVFKFTYHFFTNPMITVDGCRASARWRVVAIYTETEGRDTIFVGVEDDSYEKIDGKWLIAGIKVTTGFYSPLEEGWSKAVVGLNE